MWSVLVGGLLTIVGGAISVRWIAPWAAIYQRAQQRWEDDLVELDDLLAWELSEAVDDLTKSWNELKWELEANKSLESHSSVQARGRGIEVTRKDQALKEAMDTWRRLAGSRLELLARHVEHRYTTWGDRSVLVATVRLYRHVFSPIGGSWSDEDIGRLNTEFEQEEEIRKRLLRVVRKQGESLWPSREPLTKRMLRKNRKNRARAEIG